MRYVQAKDGIFNRHIYDISPNKWDENTFCNATALTKEQAVAFGVSKLKFVTPPYFNPAHQKREEGPAVFIDGEWTQNWVVTELSAEEVAAKADAQKAVVRAERNAKLAATDWTQLPDSTANKEAWASYRQALRDLTSQAGFPWEVTWPEMPQ